MHDLLILNLQAEHLGLMVMGTLLLLLELDIKLLELLLSHEFNFSICLLGHTLLTLIIKLLLAYCIVVLQHSA